FTSPLLKNMFNANENFMKRQCFELLKTIFNNHSYHSHSINFERDESDVMDECFTRCSNNIRSDEY
ncbi:10497_t:CDS:2, partial [Funneliformis caledonium]